MTIPQQSREWATGAQDHIEILLGASLVHLPLVRAVASDIALCTDFDVDTMVDFELAVDEACASLIPHAIPGSLLSCWFSIGPDSIVAITTVTSTQDAALSPATFGWHMLTTLTDTVISWAEQIDDTLQHVHIEFVTLGYPGSCSHGIY